MGDTIEGSQLQLIIDDDSFIKRYHNSFTQFSLNKAKITENEPLKQIFKEEYSTGIDGLPSQTQNLIAKKDATFNLLLVGESGLGN